MIFQETPKKQVSMMAFLQMKAEKKRPCHSTESSASNKRQKSSSRLPVPESKTGSHITPTDENSENVEMRSDVYKFTPTIANKISQHKSHAAHVLLSNKKENDNGELKSTPTWRPLLRTDSVSNSLSKRRKESDKQPNLEHDKSSESDGENRLHSCSQVIESHNTEAVEPQSERAAHGLTATPSPVNLNSSVIPSTCDSIEQRTMRPVAAVVPQR